MPNANPIKRRTLVVTGGRMQRAVFTVAALGTLAFAASGCFWRRSEPRHEEHYEGRPREERREDKREEHQERKEERHEEHH